MTSPAHTLWHPHASEEVFAPFKALLPLTDFEALVALHADNQRAIEDIVNNPAFTMPFHITTPTNGLAADRFYVPDTYYLVKVIASLSTAGSTTSTVDVKLNGTALTDASLSLASGVHVASATVRHKCDSAAGDYLYPVSTTVGTGALGLVVLLVFQPIA